MSLIRFIVKSALRNKRRVALIALSSGFSLFLLFAMQTFVQLLLNPPKAREGDLRMIVYPMTSMMDTIPISYLGRIEKLPHVKAISPFLLFPGQWRDDPRNLIRSMGMMPDRFWGVFPDIQVTPEVKQAYQELKTGAVVGRDMMRAYGWKPGDTIVLKGNLYPVDLALKIVGEYQWEFRSNLIFFNYKYISDLMGDFGRVTGFWVMADSAEFVPEIKETIDTMFHNSGAETHTDTEKTFALNMLSRIGNIQMLMSSVAVVIVFTMLLVSGSNVALTMRERAREVGILKALGYSWQWVLTLLLGEAAFLSLLSLIVAVLLSYGMSLIPLQKLTGGLIGSFRIAPLTLALTLVAGLLLGILAALPPTLRAARMTVVQAMKRVD